MSVSKYHISVVRKICEVFRAVHPECTLLTVNFFLEVWEAGAQGITISALQRRVGVTQSTASRNCLLLTAYQNAQGVDRGMNLCEFVENPEDGRSRFIKLNGNGREMAEQVSKILSARKPRAVKR